MVYINKDTTTLYVELDFQLDSSKYSVGTTWEDYKDGKWILLSEEQLAFKESNPSASVEEVFNMQLAEVPGPSEEELLQQAKSTKLIEASQYHEQRLNEIKYNETSIYVDSYTRLVKKDEANTAKQKGVETISVNEAEIPVDLVEYAMEEVADYESQCASCISSKIAQINACGVVEDVEAITIGEGYPASKTITDNLLKDKKETAENNVPEKQLTKFVKMSINSATLTDAQALTCKLLYPEWESFIGGSLSTGMRVLYNKRLYNVRQEVPTVLENQFPSIDTAALYEEINETHAGTKGDPIPYNNNMQLELGKYYSQHGIIYLCFRDSEQPVYNDLADLVDIYVQVSE